MDHSEGDVESTAGLVDIGDLPMSDRLRANVAESLEDRELFLCANAAGVVELATGLKDLGDLTQSDRAGANIAQALEGGKDNGLENVEGIIILPTAAEDTGEMTLGESDISRVRGLLAETTEALFGLLYVTALLEKSTATEVDESLVRDTLEEIEGLLGCVRLDGVGEAPANSV